MDTGMLRGQVSDSFVWRMRGSLGGHKLDRAAREDVRPPAVL